MVRRRVPRPPVQGQAPAAFYRPSARPGGRRIR